MQKFYLQGYVRVRTPKDKTRRSIKTVSNNIFPFPMINNHKYGYIPLLNPCEIINVTISKKRIRAQVLYLTPTFVCLFSLSNYEKLYIPYQKLKNIYILRKDTASERYCLECKKIHPLDEFWEYSMVCKKHINSEMEHYKYFIDKTPYYHYNYNNMREAKKEVKLTHIQKIRTLLTFD